MATVANLEVLLGARTEAAERKLRQSANIVDKLKRSVLQLGAAWLSYRTVAAIVGNIADSFERIGAIYDKSIQFNIPVAELQDFQIAAKEVGVDVEQISKGLSLMQRNISNAARDGGDLAKKLEAVIGKQDLKAFSNLSATEQFKQIADGFEKITNAADRAAIAQAIFGRSGGEMIPLLVNGRAALESANAELEKYNGHLNQMDASNVDAAGDAWGRVGTAIDAMFNKLSVGLAPLVESFAKNMVIELERLERVAMRISKFFGGGPIGDPAELTDISRKLLADNKAKFDPFEEMDLEDKFEKLTESMEVKAERMRVALLNPLEEFKDKLKEIREVSGFLDPEMVRRGIAAAVEEYRKTIEQKKPIAITANVSAAERGSQEDLARRFRVVVESQSDVQEEILDAEEEGNRVLGEILKTLQTRAVLQAARLG